MDISPSGVREEHDDARISRHGGLLSMSAGVVGILSYSCTLLMTNALEPGDFSHFAAGQMLLGMVGIVTSALVPLPLSHAVATHPQGSEGRRDALAFAVMVSFLAGLAAAVITGLVTAGFGSPSTAAVVALSSLVLFMGAAPSGWLQGELRFVRYTVKSVGEVSSRFLFSLVVIAMSWGAPGAIFGFSMGGLALLVVPKSFLRDLTWRPKVLSQKWRWLETADIALTLCVVSVLVGVDVVIVAFLDGGSAATAGFQALASIAKAPVYVAAGTVIVAFPLLRRPGVRTDDVLTAALRSFGLLALVAFAVIATAPPALGALVLPQRYHDSLALLPFLALSGLGFATVTVLATVLLALRAYRRCQVGLGLAAVFVTGGLLAGWQINGVAGLAVGCAVGSLLAAVVLAAIAYPLLPKQCGRMAVKGLLMAASLFLLLRLVDQQPVLWLLAVFATGLVVLAQLRSGGPSVLGAAWLLGRSASVRAVVQRLSGVPNVLMAPRGEKVDSESSSDSPPHDDAVAGVTDGRPLAQSARHRKAGVALPVRPSRLKLLVGFLICVGTAFGIRSIGLTQGFELWVDEMLYAQLGQSVSTGQLPTLPDGPFFLHPPGFFVVEAAVINAFGISGNSLDVVMHLRWLNAALGALSVGLAFLLVRTVGSRRSAWVAAALLSFEPFVLRSNSHVFLETLGMAAVLAGFLLVVVQLRGRAANPNVGYLALAGVLMGYGILTKDFFALCTVAPVILAVAWRRTLRLRESAILLAGMTVPYLIYFCIVIGHGMFPDWLRAKYGGVQRLIGLEKSTGFTAEGSPSLVSRLIDNAGHFGTSYLLLAICPVAAAVLCFSHRAERRLIGLMSLMLGSYGLYSASFGTFEEQYGYGVVIAGVLSAVVLGTEILERRPGMRRFLNPMALVLVVLTALLGIRLESSTDNGFAQVRDWVRQNLPADAKVSVTNSTGELAFADDKRFGVWPSAPLMRQNAANYILTQSLPTSQGYGYVQPAMLPWLEANARPLFTLSGQTNGVTTMWVVDSQVLEKAARLGVGTPSATYETGQ